MENYKRRTIEIIQDKKKGVTVAIMYVDPFEVYQELRDIIQKDFSDWDFSFEDFSGKFIMPTVFKAKTTVSEGDKFNANKGIEIAKTKVLNKYYVKRTECFRALLDDVNKTTQRLSEALKFNFKMAEQTAATISKYCE